MSIITLTDIILKYYDEVSLDIPRLEFSGNLGVVGCSGSGKTNLIKVLAGVEYIERGNILFDGKDITAMPIKKRALSLISLETSLFLGKSVLYNLMYPLKKHNIASAKAKAEQAALEYGLSANKKASALTGAEKIDLLIARALIRSPRLLLIDEPYKLGVDPHLFKARLKERIGDTQLVYATYDFDEVKDICDTFVLLRRGRIEAYGDYAQIMDGQSDYAKTVISG